MKEGVGEFSFKYGILFPVEILFKEFVDFLDAFFLDVIHTDDVHAIFTMFKR